VETVEHTVDCTATAIPRTIFDASGAPIQFAPPTAGQWNTQPPPPRPLNPGRGRGIRNRGRAQVDRDTCRICFNTGHWSYSCPLRQPPINNVNGNCSSNTYFTVILNGVKTAVLLDSGSCVNLIPHRLIGGLKLD